LIIGGDIAYDLDSHNCANYELFLNMLSDVAADLPVIFVTGNHEQNTEHNWKLFTESFQLYGLDTEKAVGISLGSLYLVPFDPYQLIYEEVSKKEDPVAQQLEKVL
jgi:predicted MPP superfamily phosphohydrolase